MMWISWLRYKLAWARRTEYIFQDFRNRFSFCPCGFFCKDCLMMAIRDEGVVKGIFYHIVWHTIFGKIYYKFEKNMRGLDDDDIYNILLDERTAR